MTQPSPKKQELRASEERFHQLVESVTDYAIFMLDGDGNVATWNAGAKKAKGYEADEIIGKHISTFYTPEDRAVGKPARILDTVRREGRVEDEGWRVRKDGTRFWADVIITLLRDDAGVVIGFAKVTRDLTERRAAAEELRRSEERFRLLIESVGDYAIYMLDPTGRVTTWNLGAERMKGYAASEIIGRSFEVFFPEEDIRDGKPGRELAAAIKDGRFEDEGWRVRKDGTRFWANVVVTALRDGKSEPMGFAKITRDLTMRREAEAIERNLVREQAARTAAETVAQRAEQSNRIKDEFLATVSHELRTPLNAIVGWAAMLREQELPPNVMKGVEIIDRNARAQVKLVDDILDVSRIIVGKLRIEPKPADLVSIVRESIEVVRPSAVAKAISISFEASADVVLLVGDAERLQQVAWNLLSNAVKFTQTRGTLDVAIRQESSTIVLVVRDNGRGIAPEFLPFVFDRFKQADATATRSFGGLGLGLALVRHIVELHGGSVAVESEGLKRGATFTVTLPVRAVMPQLKVEDAPTTPTRKAQRIAPDTLRGCRVLVVDDEPDARELLLTVLSGAGAEVETADSAAAGLEKLRSFRPNVLVSDIGMPDEDGYSLARQVRALAADKGGGIPSIALTAYTRNEDRAKALAAGFTTHVGKPVEPVDLVSAVSNLAALTPR